MRRPTLPRAFARGLACLGLVLGAKLGVAQEIPQFSRASYFSRVWTVDDGLPHNVAHRLAQDARGHLWIASSAGLVRFDGFAFREFPIPAAQADANYNVRDLGVDAVGTVVLLPALGGVWQLKDDVLSEHPAASAVAGKTLLNLFVEPSGTLWIETGAHELIRWSGGRAETYSPGQDIPLPMGKYSFAFDARGKLWIGCGDSLGSYENGKLSWFNPHLGAHLLIAPARSGGIWVSSSEGLQKWEDGQFTQTGSTADWRALGSRAIIQILEDRAGNIWAGTWRKGVFRLSKRGLGAVNTAAEGVTALLQDSEGNIWIATHGGGIARVRPTSFIALDSRNSEGDGLRDSLCDDETGAIWLARRGAGLSRFFENERQAFTVPTAGRQPEVYLVCNDRKGTVWVATGAGLFRLPVANPTVLEPFPHAVSDVHIFFTAKNGDLWIMHGDAGVGYIRDGTYHECSRLDRDGQTRIRAVAEAPNGAIWIATGRRALFEIVEGRPVLRFPSAGVSGGQVNGMLFDSRGSMWLATSGGLILRQGSRFKNFGLNEGLSDEIISQILEDDQGRLWSANRRGFAAISLADLYAVAEQRQDKIREATLGREDGLPRAFAMTGAPPIPWKGRDGRLWFGTHGGYVGIDPRTAIPQASPTPVYLDQLDVDGKPRSIRRPLKLPPGDHQLLFRFTAVNFSTPGELRLRHRLVGFDSAWVNTGNDRTATYANLAPGSYFLRVAARNQEGVWRENPTPLLISVAPAWWQTWPFHLLLIVVLATGFGGLVRYVSQRRLRRKLQKLEREHQLERERARIARDLHDELGYSVTQIGLIANRLKTGSDAAELEAGLGELASCSRRLSGELEGVVWTVSPKNDRWDRVASYLRQFALNFFSDTATSCTVTGTENAPDTPLLPEVQHHLLAILKESLNNILKHARATRVEISLTFSPGGLTLRIADNGAGFDPAAKEHSERNGLTNLRARAAELGAKLEICSSPGRGSEVLLTMKIATPSALGAHAG